MQLLRQIAVTYDDRGPNKGLPNTGNMDGGLCKARIGPNGKGCGKEERRISVTVPSHIESRNDNHYLMGVSQNPALKPCVHQRGAVDAAGRFSQKWCLWEWSAEISPQSAVMLNSCIRLHHVVEMIVEGKPVRPGNRDNGRAAHLRGPKNAKTLK
ncbi:hypothetical protein B0H17DRAFT_1144823 [Mycena rosella]|uniref:Uncharacterized protein n=1 Tax=Mycena rosella TaxID=1033263 RepID=A0AAD7CT91_MYCRO|nr:hypothetical protein B0H17DRAFT_1144823 [Mycena rosella]